jgi:hypothetical protein
MHGWDPSRETSLVIQSDLAPATWIEPLLVPRSFEVRMTVPQGFDAYARIFYPFLGESIVVNGADREEHVTWTQLAQRNGRIAHALMEQETIAVGPDGAARSETSYGSLAPEQFDALLAILARHTSSRDGWFLHWEGFGDLSERALSGQPMVQHSMREFYLFAGLLGAYRYFADNPSYWWPQDRAWCVCTDVDFAWAYLAGSDACVAEVLATPVIDAIATKPDNPARAGMDVINDPGRIVPRSY